MMDILEFIKMVKGYERRFEINYEFTLAQWRLIRWAGWIGYAGMAGKKARTPQKHYPLPKDRKDVTPITRQQMQKAFNRHDKDTKKNKFVKLD